MQIIPFVSSFAPLPPSQGHEYNPATDHDTVIAHMNNQSSQKHIRSIIYYVIYLENEQAVKLFKTQVSLIVL